MNAVINKRVRCCVVCSECDDCYTYSLYQLRDILNAMHIAIANYGQAFVQQINFGYATFCHTEKDIDKLLSLKKTIVNFYTTMRTKVMGCLCDHEFQRIKEQVGRIIDISRCHQTKEPDIRYDYSEYDAWVAQNPYCVSYDAWTKGMVACNQPSFVISATKEEKIKRVIYAIASKDTSGCLIKLLAYANKAKCENKIIASSKNTAKCKIELAALSRTHKCDISLQLYSKLLSCNLSLNAISTVLDCGGRFAFDNNGNAILKVGARSAKIDDVVKLSGGTWQNMNEAEFNEIYS